MSSAVASVTAVALLAIDLRLMQAFSDACHSSSCYARSRLTSLSTDARFGKIPTTRALLRISLICLSSGLLEWICLQC